MYGAKENKKLRVFIDDVNLPVMDQFGVQRCNEVRISTATIQGTNIFQYCTCPAGRVTYNFHSSCKHMHLSFKSVCNKEHKENM